MHYQYILHKIYDIQQNKRKMRCISDSIGNHFYTKLIFVRIRHFILDINFIIFSLIVTRAAYKTTLIIYSCQPMGE